jgi:hypothetical protein
MSLLFLWHGCFKLDHDAAVVDHADHRRAGAVFPDLIALCLW